MTLELMIFAGAVIAFINAYFFCRYGRSQYSLTFAASFVFTVLASTLLFYGILGVPVAQLFGSFDNYLLIACGVVLGIGLLILVLAKPMTYLIFLMVLCCVFITPWAVFDLPRSPSVLGGVTLAAAVGTWLVRRQLIMVIVGFFSGWNLGVALSSLLTMASVFSSVEVILRVNGVIFVVCIVGGILFQFMFYDKVFSRLPHPHEAEYQG